MMRKEYDFDKMKGRRNPYAKHLKKQVTIRIGVDVIDYFKWLLTTDTEYAEKFWEIFNEIFYYAVHETIYSEHLGKIVERDMKNGNT